MSGEGVADLVPCWYVDFPSIGIIDLDATELPSNDREMLEVAKEWMFADPSILDTIVAVASTLRQDEGAGGSALPAASEVVEGVLEESAAGTESAVVMSAPSPTREDASASLAQPTETNIAAPTTLVIDVVEGLSEARVLRRLSRLLLPRRRLLCRASPPRPLKSASPPRA
jgi:hypothetical protein